MKIDLRKCKPGDQLRIRLNHELKSCGISNVVTYVKPLSGADDYFHHMIEYSNGMRGLRTHSGSCRHTRPGDNTPDVIEIIQKKLD